MKHKNSSLLIIIIEFPAYFTVKIPIVFKENTIPHLIPAQFD